MKLQNIILKSGFKIKTKKEVYSLDSYEGEFYNSKSLYRVSKSFGDIEIRTIDVKDFYNALLDEAVKIKDKKIDLDKSINLLSNEWGFLRIANQHIDSKLGKLSEILIKTNLKNFDGRKEYEYWKLILTKLIPSTQPWFSTYIKSHSLQMRVSDFNNCIKDGVDIKYKSLSRTAYTITPTNLLSAIAIYSKSIKPRKKHSIVSVCAYSKCQKEFSQHLGAGRTRLTCSDSCKTLKSRENKKLTRK